MKAILLTSIITSLSIFGSFRAGAASVFVHTYEASSQLYSIDPDSGATTLVGAMGVSFMTDLAFSPNSQLFGITFTSLYSVNRSTGAATPIGSLGVSNMVGLDFATDGKLYGVSQTSGEFYRIDPASGAATLLFSTPFSYVGDVAYFGGSLFYASATFGDGSHLIAIDAGVGSAVDRGLIAAGEAMPGLAFAPANRLLAFSTTGGIYSITDPSSSGTSTLLQSTSIPFSGAATAPEPSSFALLFSTVIFYARRRRGTSNERNA